MNDESFAWDSADERAICKQHNERLLSPTGETLDAFLARCFAVYQAKPLATEFPPILVGKRIAEKGF